jgi:hypothetical protein
MVLCGWTGLLGLAFIIFLLMQTTLACSFLVVAVLQATYMPRPLNRCQNVDWWEFSGEKPSLFQVLATAVWESETATLQPQEVCNIFLKVWRIKIALT